MDRPVDAVGQLADPEVRVVGDAVADGHPEVHEAGAAQGGQDGVVEGGGLRHVLTLDADVIDHGDILARPLCQRGSVIATARGRRCGCPGRRSRLEVAAFDGGGHEVGEQVGGAGEGGDAEGGEGGGVVVVVGGGAVVGQGEEGDDRHARGDQGAGHPQHLVGVAAFEEVGRRGRGRCRGAG